MTQPNGNGPAATQTDETLLQPKYDRLARENILTHRNVIRQALIVFKDACAKVMKGETGIGNNTTETEEKIAECEHLLELMKDQRDLLLEGTPMGDAMTRAHYVDDDGQSLTVESLNDLMAAAGADLEKIDSVEVAEWPLELRKHVARWARAQTVEGAELVPRPVCVPDAWLTEHALEVERFRNSPDYFAQPLPPRVETEEDIIEWLGKGPWGVRTYGGNAGNEWEIVRRDDGGEVAEQFPQVFTDVDQARKKAAQFNRTTWHYREAIGVEPATTEDGKSPDPTPAPTETKKPGRRAKKSTESDTSSGVIGSLAPDPNDAG